MAVAVPFVESWLFGGSLGAPGDPAVLWAPWGWRHPSHGGVVPGQPGRRWIHLHGLFLLLRWIHLHGLFLLLRWIHLHGLLVLLRWIHLHGLLVLLRWIHLHGLVAIAWWVDLHGLDTPATGAAHPVSPPLFSGMWMHPRWFQEPLLAHPTDHGCSPGFAGSSSTKQAWCQSLELLSQLWASRRGTCQCTGWLAGDVTNGRCCGWPVASEALKSPFREATLLAREKGCPSGTGTAPQLSVCAWGSSPLLVPGQGSPRWDSSHSVAGGLGSLLAIKL